MKFARIWGIVIVLVCFSLGICSASVSNEDLTVNGISLWMDRSQVERITGAPKGTGKLGNHVVYHYDGGQVKIIYENNKVIRMTVTDRTWKNSKGLHCGGMEREIERTYGQPGVFSDHPSEKAYIYYTDNLDTIEFIAIEGYIQEIKIERRVS